MRYKVYPFALYVALAVLTTVTATFFFDCGDDLRHVVGEERDDYDPGETGEDFVRIGSFMKPVDTEWRYRVTGGREDYEIEVTVIAVTDNSYKLRERREGHPDFEYYYEFGPETDDFTTISLYEEYEVGGKRVTYRYSPPKKNLPTDGVLKKGLSWRDSSITAEKTIMGYSERFTGEFEVSGLYYYVEAIGSLRTPAGDLVAATLVKASDGLLIERRYVTNIGVLKTVTYDNDGSVTETRELLDYTLPEID